MVCLQFNTARYICMYILSVKSAHFRTVYYILPLIISGQIKIVQPRHRAHVFIASQNSSRSVL